MPVGKADIKSCRPHGMIRAEVYLLAFFGGRRFVAFSFALRVLPPTHPSPTRGLRQDLRRDNGGPRPKGTTDPSA